MIHLDAYALTYALALALCAGLSVFSGCSMRRLAAGVMVGLWLLTIALQAITGALASPLVYAVADLCALCIMAWYGRTRSHYWMWVVAGIFVVMMFNHFCYVATGQDATFLYQSVLAILGYCAMAVIGVPPLISFLRGGRRATWSNRLSVFGRRFRAYLHATKAGGPE